MIYRSFWILRSWQPASFFACSHGLFDVDQQDVPTSWEPMQKNVLRHLSPHVSILFNTFTLTLRLFLFFSFYRRFGKRDALSGTRIVKQHSHDNHTQQGAKNTVKINRRNVIEKTRDALTPDRCWDSDDVWISRLGQLDNINLVIGQTVSRTIRRDYANNNGPSLDEYTEFRGNETTYCYKLLQTEGIG